MTKQTARFGELRSLFESFCILHFALCILHSLRPICTDTLGAEQIHHDGKAKNGVYFVRPATRVSSSFGRPPTFRIAKASLPPLQTIGRKYPVQLPALPGDYLVSVKLNFRHLPPALLDEVGASHLKHLLEIVVIDECQRVIRVGGAPVALRPAR